MHDCYLQAYKTLACSTKDTAGQVRTVLIDEIEMHTSSEVRSQFEIKLCTPAEWVSHMRKVLKSNVGAVLCSPCHAFGSPGMAVTNFSVPHMESGDAWLATWAPFCYMHEKRSSNAVKRVCTLSWQWCQSPNVYFSLIYVFGSLHLTQLFPLSGAMPCKWPFLNMRGTNQLPRIIKVTERLRGTGLSSVFGTQAWSPGDQSNLSY